MVTQCDKLVTVVGHQFIILSQYNKLVTDDRHQFITLTAQLN